MKKAKLPYLEKQAKKYQKKANKFKKLANITGIYSIRDNYLKKAGYSQFWADRYEKLAFSFNLQENENPKQLKLFN